MSAVRTWQGSQIGMAEHPNFRPSRSARNLAVVQVDGPESILSRVKSFNRIREFVTVWFV